MTAESELLLLLLLLLLDYELSVDERDVERYFLLSKETRTALVFAVPCATLL